MANNNFTSYNDKTGSSYNGTDLKQLNFETNVIKTTKDPVSGLESVVLSAGPFSYSSESYINASISNFRKVPWPTKYTAIYVTFKRLKLRGRLLIFSSMQ